MQQHVIGTGNQQTDRRAPSGDTHALADSRVEMCCSVCVCVCYACIWSEKSVKGSGWWGRVIVYSEGFADQFVIGLARPLVMHES